MCLASVKSNTNINQSADNTEVVLVLTKVIISKTIDNLKGYVYLKVNIILGNHY